MIELLQTPLWAPMTTTKYFKGKKMEKVVKT